MISILIPTYNDLSTVTLNVQKLMNLNHEYEIIISDDSTLFEISKSLKSLESISYVVGPKKSAVDN